MSILKSSTNQSAAGADVPSLTPEQVIDQLRTLRAQIPEFVQLQNNRRERARMKRFASVTIDFSREAVNAVGASETVQTAIGNTPEEFHAAEDEISRWSAVETELRAMLRGVIAANLIRRQRLGHAAMQVWKVCRQLVDQADHADLLPHVEAMRRAPKFIRTRAKARAEATAPAQPAEPSKTAEPSYTP